MQIFITILAITLIAIGAFRGQPSKQEISPNTILSVSTDTSIVPPGPTISTTAVPIDLPSHTPGQEPTKTQTTPPPRVQQEDASLYQWIYPESTISARQTGKITLQSSDDPTRITNWYKNKIKNLHLNATSTVQTNTNNTIHNVLAAAGSDMSVHIDITKNPSESAVYVIITNQ